MGTGQRVLVIDEDDAFATDVVAALKERGYDAAREATAADGLRTAMAWRPEAVVVDTALPDRPGTDVLRAIRSAKDTGLQGSRVLLLSATPSDDDRLRAAVEGALDYIAKPIEAAAVATRVARCLALGPEPAARRRIQVTALRVLAAMESDEARPDEPRPDEPRPGHAALPNPFEMLTGSDHIATRRRQPADADISLSHMLLTATVGTLSARQQYIVAMIGETDTLAEAADRLGISPSALSARVRAITSRLGLSTPGELVALARRQQVLDASPEAIYGLSPDGNCLFANRMAAELFGYRREEMIGQDVHALVHHSRPDGSPIPHSDCSIAKAMHSGRTYSAEEVFWHRDGSPIWASYTVVQPGEDNEVMGCVVTVRDVTSKVRAADAVQVSHASLALALEAANTATFDVDLTTRTGKHSDNLECLLGLAPGTLNSEFDGFLTLVHPDDRGPFDLEHIQSRPVGTMIRHEFRVVLPSGEERRLRGRARLMPDALGRPARILGVVVDITDGHEQQQARQLMLDASADAFVAMDAAGLVTEWNASAERLFLHARRDVIGRPMTELIIPPRYQANHKAAIERVLANPPAAAVSKEPVELTAVRADGREFPAEVSFTTVAHSGRVSFGAFIRDITERKRLEEALVSQAVTDQLTKLPNRALLVDRLSRSLARIQPGKSVAVLFIDVDQFKVVNDSLGHSAGDAVLRAVASRLRRVTGPTDSIARFGGDSFVLVREGLKDYEASALAQQVLDAFDRPTLVDGRELRIAVSIGIALADDPATSAESLLRDADGAMYRAKEKGRGRAELFDDAMHRRAMARLELEGELRNAIDEGQLRLHYQPVIDLEANRITGVEALVRWEHPERGIIPPLDFIPVAEETGLIIPLGLWVLRTACTQSAEWSKRGGAAADLVMAVNLSGRQLGRADLVETVAAILAETGLDPTRLCLEITESILMEERAGAALKRLHALGVHMAVDDFGTGYSSLLYLRRFPVDTLKLDRFFVSGLGRNDEDTTIVRAIIDLAHALGLKALAEGVERPEQRQILRDMGCDMGQGFLWSRALPAEEMGRMLAGAALPTGSQADGMLVNDTAGAAARAADPPAPCRRVVLIDDSGSERALVRNLLHGHGGFEVVGEADCGAKGVEVAAACQPDVVLLDLSLPDMDGLDVLPLVRAASPASHIVVLSGLVSESVIRAAEAAGATACVDKMVPGPRLLAELSYLSHLSHLSTPA
ncbi:MAG TPA: EAL domain-containing protein [Acidimicrobiales bacterium]|jgi:diguanylate cyclase (GGDEF)-like protein/PAS domain S-box-containing protein|nr:EAL domain-containing protein [Acidimicrobiales bacterium]